MNTIKQFLLGMLTIGLIASCTSEDEAFSSYNNESWQKLACSTGVEQGVITSTRTIGDLDSQALPRGEYPNTLGMYIHGYINGKISENTLTLQEKGPITSIDFLYQVSDDGKKIRIAAPDNQDNVLELAIADSPDEYADANLFFFTSQKETQLDLPKEEGDKYGYTNPRNECGDILFSSDGYFFCRKENSNIGLYKYVRNDINATEEGVVEEVSTFTEKNIEVTMKRLTACVSIRIILVESTSGSSYNNIPDVEAGDDKTTAPLNTTNDALHAYIQHKHDDLLDPQKRDEHIIDVRDIMIRKKLLEMYPFQYDWEKGVIFGSAKNRASVYLCNLNYPAWVDKLTSFDNGNNHIAGVTATCDNEPFLPGITTKTTMEGLILFMSIGKRDPSIEIQGGTYDKLMKYRVSKLTWILTPNTHTYVYIPITLEEIVQLYRKLNNKPDPKTRSIQEASDEIILPSDRVIMFSKPFYTEQK